MRDWIRDHQGIVLLVAVFLGLNFAFLFVSPEQLVKYVGVENTYLTVFIIAAVGGLNSITGGVLYTSIAVFAAGGASPWLLGLAGGLGITIGDSLVFYLFRYTSKSLSVQWQERVSKLKVKVERLPQKLQYVIIYMYLGFLPLPNDIMMFTLAVLRYRFLQVLPLIFAGAVTTATLTALLGDWLPFFKN